MNDERATDEQNENKSSSERETTMNSRLEFEKQR